MSLLDIFAFHTDHELMHCRFSYRSAVKPLALIVYVLFLGVQVFFNLDTAPKPVTFTACNDVHAKKQNTSVSPLRTTGSGAWAHIRLNKRFQPASVPASVTVPAAPAVIFTCYSPVISTDDHSSTLLPAANPLRGPPVV